MTGILTFTIQSYRTFGRTKFTYVFPRYDSYRLFLEENQNSTILTPAQVEEPSPQPAVEEPSSQPAAEELPRLYPPGILNIWLTESQVDQNGYEDDCATGLPFAYYRIIMEAPLTTYQRTYLIEAMTAVTANKNQDDPVEESEDSDDDDYEGGVPLSKSDIDSHGLTEVAGALSKNHW